MGELELLQDLIDQMRQYTDEPLYLYMNPIDAIQIDFNSLDVEVELHLTIEEGLFYLSPDKLAWEN